MDRFETPPDVVIRRLPLYARSLRDLVREGRSSISSREFGDRINVTAAQIRKDLSCFGEFGKQGVGYDVERLLHQIEYILGLNQEWPVALIGIGRLGEAIARYEGFRRQGIRIAALFDNDRKKIGAEINSIPIMSDEKIATVTHDQDIKLAIIAVPASHAQKVADILVAAGVRAILNYAPVVIQVSEDVLVYHIDLVGLLHSMTYYLARADEIDVCMSAGNAS
jgi:redox-sensing transcriptional repressor